MSATDSNGEMIGTPQDPILNAAVSKCWKRLMPFMFIFYFVAFIDRVNVGFAKDAMSADLKMPASAYALGAGIFFAGYAVAGVPANILLNRIGAKFWLSAMAIIWGLLSASTGFVTNVTQFVVLRFVLGLAEAGFYPGILLLASIFFPDKTRASVIAIFVLGVPLSLTLGSPISGALLQMHGFLGQPGWFWMFVMEGLPAIILGLFGFYFLDDGPSSARFLSVEERSALVTQLSNEAKTTQARNVGATLVSLRVWHLAAIYGTIQIAVYGLIFFLPSQVAKLMGASLGFKVSFVAAIPWAVSAVGVYFIPRFADRYPALRVPISAVCMVLSAIGIAVSAFASPLLAIAALSLSAVGFLAVQPIFWTFPNRQLSGPALAAGIGFCTTMGAVCSFVAPIIRVQADRIFQSPHAGLIVMSLVSLLCAGLIVLLRTGPVRRS